MSLVTDGASYAFFNKAGHNVMNIYAAVSNQAVIGWGFEINANAPNEIWTAKKQYSNNGMDWYSLVSFLSKQCLTPPSGSQNPNYLWDSPCNSSDPSQLWYFNPRQEDWLYSTYNIWNLKPYQQSNTRVAIDLQGGSNNYG